MKPEKTPRCSCGMISEWIYDGFAEEWCESLCWRCIEIQWMKDPDNPILKSLLNPMHVDYRDSFVDYVLSETGILPEMKVFKFNPGKIPPTTEGK